MRVPTSLLLWVLVAAAPGCSSVPTVQVPKEVRVPTPVPCVDPETRPRPPSIRTVEQLLDMPDYQRTLAAWADLRKVEAYVLEAEAALEVCSRLSLPNR